MKRIFESLESARNYAFEREKSDIKALDISIGHQYSYFQGEPIGHYILEGNGGFWISEKYPADIKNGYLINPRASLFGGSSPVMAAADLKGICGITLTLLGGWEDAGIRYRNRLISWSRRLNIPISSK